MLGVSHHRAAVDVRERVAVEPAALLPRLRAAFPQAEAAVLSTCNRSELYMAAPLAADLPDAAAAAPLWAEHCEASADELRQVLEQRDGREAVHHLFRVTAGLDSRLIGEAEVLGQVRRAYEAACMGERPAAGPAVHAIFQAAIANARHARGASGLSEAGGTLGSVAVRFARALFDTLAGKQVLCVGAGEIAEATVRRMMRRSADRVTLVNRTPARAEALRQALLSDDTVSGDVDVSPWDALEEVWTRSDVLISATGATRPILDAATAKRVQRARRRRPWLVLDLAVPRDVAADVGDIGDVYLYNIDDMREVVDDDPARREAIAACTAQTEAAAARCHQDLQHRDVGRLVRELRAKLSGIGDIEAARTARTLRRGIGQPVVAGEALSPDAPDAEPIEALLAEHNRRLINKILHVPLGRMQAARTEGGDDDQPLAFYAAALRRLFELDGEEPRGGAADG